MPLRKNDEPIPHHVLQKFLGRGALGEVWLVRGPGGVQKAVKFIRLERSGIKELMAIQRMKLIHYPHLVQLTDVWMLDREGRVIPDEAIERLSAHLSTHGRLSGVTDTMSPDLPVPETLAVAMTLAEKSLADRLEECKREGAAGIPRQQLLNYFQEAAKGLDFLNQPHEELGGNSLQHCDVKPQNLLLVGDSIQICDFGLARLVGEQKTLNQVEGTLAYIAPEAARGKQPTPTTDQYSLAVSYYELLTGSFPFDTDVAAFQILAVHTSGKLDFSKVSEAERRVLRKATSLNPEKRYPSNQAFVSALIEATAPRPPGERGRSRLSRLLVPLLVLVTAAALLGRYLMPDSEPMIELPEGFVAAEGAAVVAIGDRAYPQRIVRKLDGGDEVDFLLIHEPLEEQLFYIMENKVWSGLFRQFAEAFPEVAGEWLRMSSGEDPRWPVRNVTVEQAYAFAVWLAGERNGHLPSVEQWNTAAGLYRPERQGRGPFAEPFAPGEIAVGRETEGPLPVGAASKDVSPFGVRDMAGNGAEFTRTFHVGGSEVPQPNALESDGVVLRGRSYTSPEGPVLFAQLADKNQGDAHPYPFTHPHVGFRVVLQRLSAVSVGTTD